MKDINKMKPKTSLLIKHENQYTTIEKKQARIIANHIKKRFKKDNPPCPDLQPTPMKIPFSAEELSIVINQLKNKEGAERDGIITSKTWKTKRTSRKYTTNYPAINASKDISNVSQEKIIPKNR